MYDSIMVETDPVQSISVEASIKEPDTSTVEGVEGDISLSEVTDDDNVMDDLDDDLDEEMDLDD
jgi:hypothetical protein